LGFERFGIQSDNDRCGFGEEKREERKWNWWEMVGRDGEKGRVWDD
jgi:hypothetical protein